VCDDPPVAKNLRAVRDPEPSGTAFVLSGGGNQGVAQVGMLRALLERGILPDVIVGTSIGALNGSVIATGPTLDRVDHLETLWRTTKGEQVFPGNLVKRAWNILRRDDHLIPNDGLAAMLAKTGAAETFEELEIPLRVVTADLISGEELVFVRGPLQPALLATSALPGVFPPVHYGGATLVDGAVVNLVPISHALAGPTTRIFVLDVSDPISERPLRSPLDVAVRAFAISRDQRFELELQWIPKEIEVVVLPPPVDDRDFFDFSDADRLIHEAYDLANRALDDHVVRPDRQRKRRWWKRLAS
jgi:NTE family protein